MNRNNDEKYKVEKFGVRHLKGYAVVLAQQDDYQPNLLSVACRPDNVSSNLEQVVNECLIAGMSHFKIRRIVDNKLGNNKRMFESMETLATETGVEKDFGKLIVLPNTFL